MLTSVATALFVPFELYEIYERFTFVRVLILIVNLFVIWYLATRVKDEVKEEIIHEEHEEIRRLKGGRGSAKRPSGLAGSSIVASVTNQLEQRANQ